MKRTKDVENIMKRTKDVENIMKRTKDVENMMLDHGCYDFRNARIKNLIEKSKLLYDTIQLLKTSILSYL